MGKKLAIIGLSAGLLGGGAAGLAFTGTTGIAAATATLARSRGARVFTTGIEAPVDFVFDSANHAEQSVFWQGAERRYIEIMWQEHRIWGVTAGIIANLAKRIAW